MAKNAKEKGKVYQQFISVVIALDYISLIGFIVSFEYCKTRGLELWSEALCIVFLSLFVGGFIFGFIRTGLWRYIHKPLRQLNAKEMEETSRALRIAYSVFAMLVISLLLVFSFAEFGPDLVSVIGIYLIAHTLPAAVVAWTKPFQREG